MKYLSLALLAVFLLNSCEGTAQKKPKEEKFEIQKTRGEWKAELSDSEFNILRKAGTETPYSSPLLNIKKSGTFVCAACGNELYRNERKFESGTGWPSFDKPIEGGVFFSTDNKLGYTRNEVLCSKCGGHLGHVFDDGPRETTGKRYCMNGAAMDFVPNKNQ